MSDRRTEGAAALPAPVMDALLSARNAAAFWGLESLKKKIDAALSVPLTSAAEGAEPPKAFEAVPLESGGSVVRAIPLTDEMRKLLTVSRPVHIPGAARPIESSPTSPQSGGDAERLRKAAQAVVDRWDSPHWKWTGHTGDLIHALRSALSGVSSGAAGKD